MDPTVERLIRAVKRHRAATRPSCRSPQDDELYSVLGPEAKPEAVTPMPPREYLEREAEYFGLYPD